MKHLLHGGRVVGSLHTHPLLKRLHQASGRLSPQISHEQSLFDLVPDILINAISREQSQKPLAQHVVRPRQTGTQPHQTPRNRRGSLNLRLLRLVTLRLFGTAGIIGVAGARVPAARRLRGTQKRKEHTDKNQHAQHNCKDYPHSFIHTTSLPVHTLPTQCF